MSNITFKNLLKKSRYVFESLFVSFGLNFFGLFSVQRASNLAGKIAVLIGKRFSVTKLAYKNLSNAMPNLTKAEKKIIIDNMWDNLGRVIGEFTHVCKFSPQELLQYIELDQESKANIEDLIKQNRGGIFFSAHFGNWEVGPKILQNYSSQVNSVYRPLNNPYVEKMTASLRGVEMIEKGNEGSRKLINVLKNKGFVMIMADQKITNGEPIKFFHDDAITTTSIAKIAMKMAVPLVPSFVLRIDKKFKFKIVVEKPLEFNKEISINQEAKNVTLKINQCIERWVAKNPEQWFWVHNRWKK